MNNLPTTRDTYLYLGRHWKRIGLMLTTLGIPAAYFINQYIGSSQDSSKSIASEIYCNTLSYGPWTDHGTYSTRYVGWTPGDPNNPKDLAGGWCDGSPWYETLEHNGNGTDSK